ncbi:hypothetical protein BDV36DRAFT_16907 [Aspergillus pseudocaelatus]|uniref:Uncharacterized protein n=1 Tax=Aspergillus pseudocaelatus TaxID=1825620 RepID=A0ABQ6WA67_9EURO|nr:hypothetical protein BDV36DRAFT_16907 [Aspergillus pseudocaelatus]
MEYLNPSGTLQNLSFLYIYYLEFAALSPGLHVMMPFATNPLLVYPHHVSATRRDTTKNNALLQPLCIYRDMVL